MNDQALSAYVERFPACRVGVLGDLMLDRYVWGRATRISQEAPVPVVHVQRETSTPGGAANVVRNLVSLGAQATAFGVVGEDRYAQHLTGLLRDTGANVDQVLSVPGWGTTVKTRVIAGSQQVVRIDREESEPVPQEWRLRVAEQVEEAIARHAFDALIIEDYAKGLLDRDMVARIVAACRAHGIFATLDPHPSHPFNVPGLRLMTPNRAEAFALAGVYYQSGGGDPVRDASLLQVGRQLAGLWAPEMLLVTLGADGMALFGDSPLPLHIPTRARQVFDVSGAGDTVMSVFVLALLAGADPEASAKLANHAAGIVVGKIGTAAVTTAELLADLLEPCPENRPH